MRNVHIHYNSKISGNLIFIFVGLISRGLQYN